MDLVYVVRPGDDNEPLRYSLRSVEKNLPHRRIWIAGYKPSWVCNVIQVPRDQTDQPDLTNTNENLRAAIASEALSDDFILMNDDFIVFEPYTPENNHQGDLDAVIERYKKTVMLQAYSLKTTKMELVRLGVMPPYYSYELHTPFVYNKQKLRDLFAKTKKEMFSIRPRSFYGNFYKIEGKEISDVKGPKPLQQLWSAEQGALERGARGAEQPTSPISICRRAFPRPCKYELPESFQSKKRQDIHHTERGASSSLR